MRRGEMMIPCYVSATKETLEALDAWAQRHQATRSAAIRQALQAFLEGRLEPAAESKGGRLFRTYMFVPPDWLDRLDKESRSRGQQRAELMRKAVEAWLGAQMK